MTRREEEDKNTRHTSESTEKKRSFPPFSLSCHCPFRVFCRSASLTLTRGFDSFDWTRNQFVFMPSSLPPSCLYQCNRKTNWSNYEIDLKIPNESQNGTKKKKIPKKMETCQNNNAATSGLEQQQQLMLLPVNLVMDDNCSAAAAATTAAAAAAATSLRMAKRQRDPVDEDHLPMVSCIHPSPKRESFPKWKWIPPVANPVRFPFAGSSTPCHFKWKWVDSNFPGIFFFLLSDDDEDGTHSIRFLLSRWESSAQYLDREIVVFGADRSIDGFRNVPSLFQWIDRTRSRWIGTESSFRRRSLFSFFLVVSCFTYRERRWSTWSVLISFALPIFSRDQGIFLPHPSQTHRHTATLWYAIESGPPPLSPLPYFGSFSSGPDVECVTCL